VIKSAGKSVEFRERNQYKGYYKGAFTTRRYTNPRLPLPYLYLLRRSRSFKVIKVGTNRKPVCDSLLVINSNWQSYLVPFRSYLSLLFKFCSNAVTLTQNFRYKGSFPPIIFAGMVRPMNALQLCPWQFSHRCYGWGATSENRGKIDYFAPTRSLWSKISGERGRPPPIIFARLVRPMNALQLCRWQFSQKETL